MVREGGRSWNYILSKGNFVGKGLGVKVNVVGFRSCIIFIEDRGEEVEEFFR